MSSTGQSIGYRPCYRHQNVSQTAIGYRVLRTYRVSPANVLGFGKNLSGTRGYRFIEVSVMRGSTVVCTALATVRLYRKSVMTGVYKCRTCQLPNWLKGCV